MWFTTGKKHYEHDELKMSSMLSAVLISCVFLALCQGNVKSAIMMPPLPHRINEISWWWMFGSVINGQWRLTVWVTNPGAKGSWRLSKGVGLDCLEGDGLSVHTHWCYRDKDNKNTGKKENKRRERGLKLKGSHTICRESMGVYPTWEGGEVEKEVVQTSWESWTPGKAPLSSSSGALDTQTHYLHHCLHNSIFKVYLVLSLSKEWTFPYVLVVAGLSKIYWPLAATGGVHKVIHNNPHDGTWMLKLSGKSRGSQCKALNVLFLHNKIHHWTILFTCWTWTPGWCGKHMIALPCRQGYRQLLHVLSETLKQQQTSYIATFQNKKGFLSNFLIRWNCFIWNFTKRT